MEAQPGQPTGHPPSPTPPAAPPIPAPPPEKRRILFLDAYDSFTNNIVALLTTLLSAEVHILRIDDPYFFKEPSLADNISPKFLEELKNYDALVCGPGPGRPHDLYDIGLMRFVWSLTGEDLLPILGICLGFQTLVFSNGVPVKRLRRGLHGRIWKIMGNGIDIFEGVGEFKATLYHSLGVVIRKDGDTNALMGCRKAIQPLAWAEGEKGENILMAVRTVDKPFWGLQYHPESVCTDKAAHGVLLKWWDEAEKWNHENGRQRRKDAFQRGAARSRAMDATKKSLLYGVRGLEVDFGVKNLSDRHNLTTGLEIRSWAHGWRYFSSTIPMPAGLSVPDLVDMLREGNRDVVLLDSSNAGEIDNAVRGRYSILGLDMDAAMRIEYQAGKSFFTVIIPNMTYEGKPRSDTAMIPLDTYGNSIWHFLADFQDRRKLELEEVRHVPFAGGFMGYITYEMGLHDIHAWFPKKRMRGHKRPDVSLAWVTKSVVVDHEMGEITMQCLSSNDRGRRWVAAIKKSVETATRIWQKAGAKTKYTSRCSGEGGGQSTNGGPNSNKNHDPSPSSSPSSTSTTTIQKPDPGQYEAKVAECQISIAGGYSYELCLTDQTTITRTHPRDVRKEDIDDSWQLYQALRKAQPAPFASYVRLGNTTIVSGSPERFLQYKPRPVEPTEDKNGTHDKNDTNGHSNGSVPTTTVPTTTVRTTTVPTTTVPTTTAPTTTTLSATTRPTTNPPTTTPLTTTPATTTLPTANASTPHPPPPPSPPVEWICTMSPMKGTLPRGPPPSIPTLSLARTHLSTPKEIAENLMIVDLVLHDLHTICPASSVHVTQLMTVEQHASVWQMVTLIEGILPSLAPAYPFFLPVPMMGVTTEEGLRRRDGIDKVTGQRKSTRYTGLDVLAASLPAGSMTGAPKKRSCELLSQIEGWRERGVYSGVVGYMDVGGRGDWSVTIRSLVRYDDESSGFGAPVLEADLGGEGYEFDAGFAYSGEGGSYVEGVYETEKEGDEDRDGDGEGGDRGNSEENGNVNEEGNGEGVGIGKRVGHGVGIAEVKNTERWHIGAGGAITILSTAKGEREEMFTKLGGPLGVAQNFWGCEGEEGTGKASGSKEASC